MLLLVFSLITLIHGLDPALVEREKLAFIERAIVSVFSKGQFPEIFGAETQVLVNCGCGYGTMNVYWGTRVGLFCKFSGPGYEPGCGTECRSPKGEGMLLLCPEGWASDCSLGCVPPQFDTTVQRVQFLENTVDAITRYGYDYSLIQESYLEMCGCANSAVNHVKYGSKIGYDCVFYGQPGEQCRGWGPCEDSSGDNVQLFCPAGYTPSCTGCHKAIDFGADMDQRIDWCIDAITGYVQETEVTLDLVPTNVDVVSCGCTDLVKKVDYGLGLGYSCHINENSVAQECQSSHAICQDNEGKKLVHFCPYGFVASCDVGCGHWWKQEL